MNLFGPREWAVKYDGDQPFLTNGHDWFFVVEDRGGGWYLVERHQHRQLVYTRGTMLVTQRSLL